MEASPVHIDKVLGYVVGWLGGIVRLAALVPSHDISEAGTRDDVSDNSVYNIYVFGIFVVLLRSIFGVCLFLC